MKSNLFAPSFSLAALLGAALITPVLAQGAPANLPLDLVATNPVVTNPAVSNPAVSNPAAVTHSYHFEAQEVPAPAGGTVVFVRLSDTFDPTFHKRVLYILDDAGKYTRKQRAQIVADRLQKACDADPDFVSSILPPVTVGTEVVLKLKSQASQPDGFIITADEGSMRAVNASSREEYANIIIANIKARLAGIKLRDAAFDYELTDPKEKNARAAEYFDEANDAYESSDHDTEVAISKCELAVGLEPGYQTCRLLLADLYVETHQMDKARQLYQQVASAVDTFPADKKVAADKLTKLSRG